MSAVLYGFFPFSFAFFALAGSVRLDFSCDIGCEQPREFEEGSGGVALDDLPFFPSPPLSPFSFSLYTFSAFFSMPPVLHFCLFQYRRFFGRLKLWTKSRSMLATSLSSFP